MSIKASEIRELASRYVDEEDMIDLPEAGEVFCLFQREIPKKKILKDHEGWNFAGYARLDGYFIDETAKPVGKWIDLAFTSLAMYPPQQGQLRLQPPHIALGKFQDPTRTFETRIEKLAIESDEDDFEEDDDNVVSFPKG